MQFPLSPVPVNAAAQCDFLAFTTTATFPTLVMAVGGYYVFIASAACWVQQGSAPVATKAAGSMYVPANLPVVLDGRNGAKLAVLQDSAGGNASLVKVML